MKKALVLIDWQNEWINENSTYCVGNIDDELERLNRLLDFCRRNRYKIIFTRHIEPGSVEAFVEDQENSQIISKIKRQNTDIIVIKHKISSFYETNLDVLLKNFEQVVVAGILTNLCVRSFVADAYDRDFVITVIKDCCVAFDDDIQEFTFEDLKTTREEIKFYNTEEFIKAK